MLLKWTPWVPPLWCFCSRWGISLGLFWIEQNWKTLSWSTSPVLQLPWQSVHRDWPKANPPDLYAVWLVGPQHQLFLQTAFAGLQWLLMSLAIAYVCKCHIAMLCVVIWCNVMQCRHSQKLFYEWGRCEKREDPWCRILHFTLNYHHLLLEESKPLNFWEEKLWERLPCQRSGFWPLHPKGWSNLRRERWEYTPSIGTTHKPSPAVLGCGIEM